jgi:hypothetical protein
MAYKENEDAIFLRIPLEKKNTWKKLCIDKNITLTSLIINSVEGKILDNERRKILMFIEKQDNIFGKIETNINQVAKKVNGQKFISEVELKNFTEKLNEVTELKKQQNEIFSTIYQMLAR